MHRHMKARFLAISRTQSFSSKTAACGLPTWPMTLQPVSLIPSIAIAAEAPGRVIFGRSPERHLSRLSAGRGGKRSARIP